MRCKFSKLCSILPDFPRVVIQYSFVPGAAVNVCVYFRRHDAFMSEQLLHTAKISTAIQQMCSKRMAQCVWRYGLGNTC